MFFNVCSAKNTKKDEKIVTIFFPILAKIFECIVMGRILLRNISLDGRKCDIHVEGAVIRKICGAGSACPGTAADGVEIVDCTGKTALPGFVNMHTHAAMTLLRGVGEDVSFSNWIDRIWETEKKIDEEYIYWATKVACIEMIKTGTTAFYDQYWIVPAAERAVREMGLRAVLSYVHLDHYDREKAMAQRRECEELFADSSGWPDTVGFAVAIHSVYSVSEEQILWATDFARTHGLKINIHLCETEQEVKDCRARHGASPVKYLDSLGVLGPDVTAAHTLWVDDEDIGILAGRKVTCVHNINSNMKLACGYRFRYNEMRDAGINLCFGTDGCASSNNLDLHEAMKTAALVQKAWRGDPAAMPLDELIRMATSNGADAIGINAGKIEEGRLADILVVDTGSSFFLSNAPFLANFIYSAHSDCIDSVICNGEFVMRNRAVPMEKEILAEAGRILKKY